jgi:hypothetical protein
VKDIVTAHALPPISMKGISREVVPYVIERPADAVADAEIAAHAPGLDLRLDPDKVDDIERASAVLRNAMAALARRGGAPAEGPAAV